MNVLPPRRRRAFLLVLLASALVAVAPAGAQDALLEPAPPPGGANAEEVASKFTLDQVWSGHPVDFDILAKNGHVFVAYYDENQQMTVAHRRIGDPEEGWLSHPT